MRFKEADFKLDVKVKKGEGKIFPHFKSGKFCYYRFITIDNNKIYIVMEGRILNPYSITSIKGDVIGIGLPSDDGSKTYKIINTVIGVD